LPGPQKENGYTPIANEIMEQLYKLPFNGTQFRIILAVFRYTYGFSRKEHELSETFISSCVSASRRNVQREIKALIAMDILKVTKQASFNATRELAFNKHYEVWRISHLAANSSPGDKPVTTGGGELVITPSSDKLKEKNLQPSGDNVFDGVVANPSSGGEQTAQDKQYIKTKYKTKEQKPKKQNPNTILINFFCDEYKIKFGNPYMPNWKRDGAIIKDFLDNEYTADYMKTYITWFLNSNDEYLNKVGYSIPLLKTRLEKYHLKQKKELSKYPDQSNYFKGGSNVPE